MEADLGGGGEAGGQWPLGKWQGPAALGNGRKKGRRRGTREIFFSLTVLLETRPAPTCPPRRQESLEERSCILEDFPQPLCCQQQRNQDWAGAGTCNLKPNQWGSCDSLADSGLSSPPPSTLPSNPRYFARSWLTRTHGAPHRVLLKEEAKKEDGSERTEPRKPFILFGQKNPTLGDTLRCGQKRAKKWQQFAFN